ncbi:hypothetical protein ACP70R_008078 [Stipagrostis hirtigluma subsp. patula]
MTATAAPGTPTSPPGASVLFFTFFFAAVTYLLSVVSPLLKSTAGKMADIVLSIVEKFITFADMFRKAVQTDHQNNEDCRSIERCCVRVKAILSEIKEMTPQQFQLPSTSGALQDLAESVQNALKLVTKCQEPSHRLYRYWKAQEMADKLRRVQEEIQQKLLLGNIAINVQNSIMLTKLIDILLAFAQSPSQPSSGNFPPPPAPASSANDAPNFGNPSVTSTNIPQTIRPHLPVVDGINQLSSSVRVDSTTDIKPFSLSELQKATENFSDVIHHFGNFVYKGILNNGSMVAIKEHDSIDDYMVRDGDNIQDKIDMVSKFNHKNIVRPLGYCHVEELKTFYFVEDYMPGSMDKFIAGLGADWSSCFRIIQGIAQGVQYLHERHIVHLNLKPSIILLDSDMNPKIGDSLLYTRLDNGDREILSSTPPLISIDYIAPEYKQRIVSTKSDMYPFGVILLEITSRMCKSKSKPWNVKDLPRWARNELESKGIEKLLHPSLRGNKSQVMEIERCMKVGLLCVQPDRKERPTMADVLAMLNGA